MSRRKKTAPAMTYCCRAAHTFTVVLHDDRAGEMQTFPTCIVYGCNLQAEVTGRTEATELDEPKRRARRQVNAR